MIVRDDFLSHINDCGLAHSGVCRYKFSRFAVPVTAIMFHCILAILLLTGVDVSRATNVGIMLLVIPSATWLGLCLLLASAMTLLAFFKPQFNWKLRFLLALPQQTFLVINALGVLHIMASGVFPGDVVAPVGQILAGQSLTLIFPALHAVAIWQVVQKQND